MAPPGGGIVGHLDHAVGVTGRQRDANWHRAGVAALRHRFELYPRELDGALALERERLEAWCEKLRDHPAENHGPTDVLKLPHNLEIAPQVQTQVVEAASLV